MRVTGLNPVHGVFYFTIVSPKALSGGTPYHTLMPDFAKFFEQALLEHGVEARVVKDDDPTSDQFTVMKPVGDETLSYRTSINTRINTTDEQIKKEIVHHARNVAGEFEEYLTDTFEWGDGRRATVSVHEGGWAKCEHCGNEVEIPQVPQMLFSEDAELSTPQPLPCDRESILNNLDDGSLLLLKMYLIGRLRERCAWDCQNQKHNDLDKSDAYKTGRFYEYEMTESFI